MYTLTRAGCTYKNYNNTNRYDDVIDDGADVNGALPCVGKMTVNSGNDTRHTISLTVATPAEKAVKIHGLLIACEMCQGPVIVQLLSNGSPRIAVS
jgi:hypothetical protein